MQFPLKESFPDASRLIFGCMGLGGGWDNQPVDKAAVRQAHDIVDVALEMGVTVFDHADIYALGKAEQVFGKVLQERPTLRQSLVLQSKCGIRFADDQGPKRYDFSREWVTHSIDQILKRLDIEHLDMLLLHRPDPLMEPEELAEALVSAQQAGKIGKLGVSNMHLHHIAYLQDALGQSFVAHQMELGLHHLAWLEASVTSGCSGWQPTNFAPGTFEYCQQHNIQIQAWASLSKGQFTRPDAATQPAPGGATSLKVRSLAEEYGCSSEAILLAWLMRHPAGIQPVIGTTHPERLKACGEATAIRLSREHWYSLYETARGGELP